MRDRRGLLLALLAMACGGRFLTTSQPGELRTTPQQLDFGEVYVGQISTVDLQVSNSSKSNQSAALILAAPFDVQSALEVSGGASSPLQVSFRPTAEGSFEASLIIGTQAVALRGKGLPAPECREPPTSCRTSTLDPANGQCVVANKPDGAGCASRCVTGGSCSAGSCVGTLANCADNNACTDDGCSDTNGCVHTPRSCPVPPSEKCQVASCDPVSGCHLADAIDGASCGPRSCRTNTTRVCILGRCVDRPLPTHECLNLFAYLKSSNSEAGDSFGSRSAISADGSTLAVGTFIEASSSTRINGNQFDNTAPQSGAVYVFRRVTGAWLQEAYVKASNTGAGDSFGYSVALSADGSTLVVGAHLEDSSAHDSGAAYVFRRVGSTWSQEAYLKASNTGQGDYFGTSVAISASGDTLAVGASGEDSKATGLNGNQANNAAVDSGAVYLFRNGGLGWQQEAYVKASTVDSGDQFGFTVALSPDGSALAVAAPGEDSKATGLNGTQADNAAPQSGAVFLFRRTTSWAQEAFVKASNTGAGDAFGIGLSLSTNGDVLAVGAYGEDSSATGVNGSQADNAASQSGAAYVFRQTAGAWAQEAYVKASNTNLGDDFGFSLSLSGDGNILAVGAWSENSSATGIDGHQFNNDAPDSGAVYLFKRTNSWMQDGYLKASNTEAGDVFGYSVAMSNDGSTLVTSALGEDSSARGVNGSQSDNSATDSGAVYVFSTQ